MWGIPLQHPQTDSSWNNATVLKYFKFKLLPFSIIFTCKFLVLHSYHRSHPVRHYLEWLIRRLLYVNYFKKSINTVFKTNNWSNLCLFNHHKTALLITGVPEVIGLPPYTNPNSTKRCMLMCPDITLLTQKPWIGFCNYFTIKPREIFL